jgi:hypothetical protein
MKEVIRIFGIDNGFIVMTNYFAKPESGGEPCGPCAKGAGTVRQESRYFPDVESMLAHIEGVTMVMKLDKDCGC